MEKYKIIFLFTGQGSQYRGMGQRLFENNSIFRTSIEKSDAIVKECINKSLIQELYFSYPHDFDNLLITHPAIVAIEIAMYRVLKSINITPQYIYGSSLGEFAASVVAGIWDEETAIRASIAQAESIIKKGIEGGLLAVIDQENTIVKEDFLNHDLFLGADNFDGHFTLSGISENLEVYQSKLMARGIQFVRLPVKVPFHSPLILDSLADFNAYMANQVRLHNPKSGFISGIKCKELHAIPENYFGEVVSLYTDYPKLVKYIENKGPCLYIDLGPSGTGSTFVKYNLEQSSKSRTFQIMTPFRRELEQLQELQELFKCNANY